MNSPSLAPGSRFQQGPGLSLWGCGCRGSWADLQGAVPARGWTPSPLHARHSWALEVLWPLLPLCSPGRGHSRGKLGLGSEGGGPCPHSWGWLPLGASRPHCVSAGPPQAVSGALGSGPWDAGQEGPGGCSGSSLHSQPCPGPGSGTTRVLDGGQAGPRDSGSCSAGGQVPPWCRACATLGLLVCVAGTGKLDLPTPRQEASRVGPRGSLAGLVTLELGSHPTGLFEERCDLGPMWQGWAQLAARCVEARPPPTAPKPTRKRGRPAEPQAVVAARRRPPPPWAHIQSS